MGAPNAFSLQSYLAEALRRLEGTEDPRLKDVMTAFNRHMFAFIEEVKPSEAEWLTGIQFLTEVGQKCDERRQEFILMSDTLGVTMLVDHLSRAADGDVATESSVLGPFYREKAPRYQNGQSISQDGIGEVVTVTGHVRDTEGRAIAGATIDVWQTAPNGLYEVQDEDQPDYNLRGFFTTDTEGRYEFRTVKPVSYPVPDDGPVGRLLRALGRHCYRPAHIHFIVGAKGHFSVTTQLFTDDDEYLDSDAVFGVKDSLVVHYQPDGDGYCIDYDFVLVKD